MIERLIDLVGFVLFLVVWLLLFCVFFPLTVLDWIEDRERRRVPE